MSRRQAGDAIEPRVAAGYTHRCDCGALIAFRSKIVARGGKYPSIETWVDDDDFTLCYATFPVQELRKHAPAAALVP